MSQTTVAPLYLITQQLRPTSRPLDNMTLDYKESKKQPTSAEHSDLDLQPFSASHVPGQDRAAERSIPRH